VSNLIIRPVYPNDNEWIRKRIAELWGSEVVLVHGVTYRPVDLAGFIALLRGERSGLVTYHIADGECEIVTLNSLCPSMGIGTKLIEAVREAAREAGCGRLWLITTNDNVRAIRFYQKRNFTLVAVHRNAVERAREIKPEIPAIGYDDIPIRDEIELEMIL
jgi:GNAT superfamily N-acetyltransferase